MISKILSFCCVIVCLSFFSLASSAQQRKEYSMSEINKAEALFEAGNKLMEQKKFSDALVKFKEALAVTSDSLGLLYNGGLAAFETNDYPLALDLWKRLKTGDPDDMQARAKLIQTYQILGKFSDRDTEREELFKLRKEGKSNELASQDFYVREQSVIAGRRIMAFEHFELKGDRALRYVFYILDAKGKAEFRISLGSYAMTNAVWRSTTKPTPKEGERFFHLDGYFDWGHATYGMYPKAPTYDETREIVKNILEKEKTPRSSSTIVKQPEKPKENEKQR